MSEYFPGPGLSENFFRSRNASAVSFAAGNLYTTCSLSWERTPAFANGYWPGPKLFVFGWAMPFRTPSEVVRVSVVKEYFGGTRTQATCASYSSLMFSGKSRSTR
eukprot:CAMPEP_0170247374 /NCGR_PEP_ID=MMETSP0116_2-20130129/23475_1 /TAXON_ID=400756 /ORGANISM="Durinskia baltica, Strain CSIRO CS-38" /LENGTH=104 /DNA_ID=CAMNT_0010498253 /DNA_START=206 /DNA_END=520 /DNA_ORIENTATION=+